MINQKITFPRDDNFSDDELAFLPYFTYFYTLKVMEYMQTHNSTHTFTHAHMHTCTHTHVPTHSHMHTCTHAHIHTYPHIHWYLFSHTQMLKVSHSSLAENLLGTAKISLERTWKSVSLEKSSAWSAMYCYCSGGWDGKQWVWLSYVDFMFEIHII